MPPNAPNQGRTKLRRTELQQGTERQYIYTAVRISKLFFSNTTACSYELSWSSLLAVAEV